MAAFGGLEMSAIIQDSAQLGVTACGPACVKTKNAAAEIVSLLEDILIKTSGRIRVG